MSEEEYDLTINLSQEQLEIIHEARANVVIGKAPVGERVNVAWLVFKPMQKNVLKWVNHYGVYASTCKISQGSEIIQRSSIGAAMYRLYTLQANGGFSSSVSGGSADTFTVYNNYTVKKVMTIGLYQHANVNGDEVLGNAISAAPVMTGHTASITPNEHVYIWLQSNIKSNTVITKVTSRITPLFFSDAIRCISVTYNDESGMFTK